MDNGDCYVIYARTSKDTDDAFSVTSQVEAGLNFARANSLFVPEEYVFREDFTGKAFDRPEYAKVRALIKARRVKGVIVYATDRLARRVSVGELYLDEMLDNGVTLFNVSWGQALRNTPEDRLRFNFETTFSSFERDKIIERTTRGRRTKAESGKLPGQGRPPFGYNLNETKNNLVPNQYAPYVKEILESYAWDCVGGQKLADMLNARGIPTPGIIRANDIERIAKLQFEAKLIHPEAYDKKILHAQRMWGHGKWNKTIVHLVLARADAYAGDYLIHVRDAPYHVEVPPIISIETRDKVKKMLSIGRNRLVRRYRCGSDDFLMARRLTCANDGYAFGARVKTGSPNFKGYYACQCGQMGKRCTNKPIRDDVLDPIAMNFLRDLLLHPDRLFAWREEQNRKNESTNAQIQEEITQVQDHIAETKEVLVRILDFLAKKLDDFDRAHYENRKAQNKETLREYEERLAELEGSVIVSKVNPAVIQTVAEMGKKYRDVLETSTELSFWRGLVDDLDLTGEIGTDAKGEYVEFILFEEKRTRLYVSGGDGGIEFDGIW